MKTRILDMSNPEELEAAQIAYYLLYSPELQCIEQKTTPEVDHLKKAGVIVVAAYDDEGIAGVMMVDRDNVVFPVIGRDHVEVLKAMSLAAFEANGGYLEFQTKNETIQQLALAMNIPEIKHNGNFFWWGAKSTASEWGAK